MKLFNRCENSVKLSIPMLVSLFNYEIGRRNVCHQIRSLKRRKKSLALLLGQPPESTVVHHHRVNPMPNHIPIRPSLSINSIKNISKIFSLYIKCIQIKKKKTHAYVYKREKTKCHDGQSCVYKVARREELVRLLLAMKKKRYLFILSKRLCCCCFSFVLSFFYFCILQYSCEDD